MMHETLSLHDLAIGYTERSNRKLVAHHLSATLCSGELTCLLGTNGTGKSTLFRTLSGLQPSLNGTIDLFGKPLSTYNRKELAKQIGLVLTEKPVSSYLRVDEVVGMGRMPYTNFWGNLNATDNAKVKQAIAQVGLSRLAKRQLGTLSDGERQKAMIARTLTQETPIIFLDEPTAFLDFPSKLEVMQLLQHLAKDENKTILLSTHDLELALQIAHRLWILTPMGTLQTGTPKEMAAEGYLDLFFTGTHVRFDREKLQYVLS